MSTKNAIYIDDLVPMQVKPSELDKYNFKTTKLDKVYFLDKLNLDDRQCGGNLAKVAKVSDSPLFIGLDSSNNTIGLFARNVDIKAIENNKIKHNGVKQIKK
jgi:hypothetical protein